MTSNENKFETSSNDSKSENQKIGEKALSEEESEDELSHSHPAVTEKDKVFNLTKAINSKQFRLSNSGSGSERSAFFSSLESIISIIEAKNWIPRVLYVAKPKNSSDNNFEIVSTNFVPNILKPPIPSEWGNEKTELPESERLKNLNILLISEPSIPPPEKKKKKNQSKVKDSIKDTNLEFSYDTSFDPEKEFLELNSRYPPSSPNKNLEKSSKPVSEDKIIIRNSKKNHNFQEKPIVHVSNPFLELKPKRVSKPYEAYLPISRKKWKKVVFESKPGTSKMESDYESLSSNASEVEPEKKCQLSSLKIDKPFPDFSLQGVKLDTFGNRIEALKNKKVQISEPVRKSKEKLYTTFSSTTGNAFEMKSIKDDLHLEGENTDKIKVSSSDDDSIVNEFQLEQSLEEFLETKEDDEDNDEESNINEEDDEHLVFSWSSSDLGISRWSLPSRATSVSNSIFDRLSVNYVLNRVVERFIDVKQLSPITYSQRPAGNFRECNQEVKSQEASASHKS